MKDFHSYTYSSIIICLC